MRNRDQVPSSEFLTTEEEYDLAETNFHHAGVTSLFMYGVGTVLEMGSGLYFKLALSSGFTEGRVVLGGVATIAMGSGAIYSCWAEKLKLEANLAEQRAIAIGKTILGE